MFGDLSQIFSNQSELAKLFLDKTSTELELTSLFKEKYSAVYSDSEDEIFFEKFTAKLITKKEKVIIIPNQWFYLAFLAAPYYQEFVKYKSFLSDKLRHLDSKKYESFFRDAKNGNIDNELFELVTADLEEKDIQNIKNFISNYNWWNGGKTIDRGDCYVSPILALLHLINASSEYVATITSNLVNHDFNLQNNFEYFKLQSDLDNNQVDVFEPIAIYDSIPCKQRKDLVQEIHFGAPGTGKSYSLAQIIGESYKEYKDTDDNPFVFRTTVHNEYSYFDFVGNVMPKSDEGKIDYTFEPGVFTLALEKALTSPQYDIYLVIEEMSRGNIASIFGDIFQLLDRDDNGVSEYRINNSMIADYINRTKNGEKDGERVNKTITLKKIYLPSNLHILGTANTSDQNVNVIDTAFKRRFGFVYEQVSPEPQKVKNEDGKEIDLIVDGKVVYLNSFIFSLRDDDDRKYEWNDFYQKLNMFIVDQDNGLGLTEDKQLGQFFVKFKQSNDDVSDEEEKLKKANFNSIRNKVLHYLWEDVQSVSMTNNRIFNAKLTSFSSLYALFDYEKLPKSSEVFSTEFLTFYDNVELGQ